MKYVVTQFFVTIVHNVLYSNIYETQIRDKPENGIWAIIIYFIYFKFSLIHLLSENPYVTKLSHSFFIDLFEVLIERNAILDKITHAIKNY